MAPILYKCLFFTVTCWLFVSCSKKSGDPNTYDAATGTVYITGDDGSNPILWTNGTANKLSTSGGSASQVITAGNDVYIAGVIGQAQSFNSPGGASGQYVYWKNGVANNIGHQGFIRSSSSIAIAGSDIYYANSSFFRNNVQVSLPGQGSGSIGAIFVTGNDIYCAGSDSVGDAVYWKNGSLQVVSKGYYPAATAGADPSIFCLYVSGNDVYIGGLDGNNAATYWKNGTAAKLQSAGGTVTGIRSLFVSGNDVYAAASILTPAGSDAPTYFENGVEHDLPLNGAAYGIVNCIYVHGSDVYVAGHTSNGAVYWKNGVQTILSPNGNANSIYVQ